jgi:glycine cleavage system H protein
MPEYLETTVDKFTFRVATDRLYSPEGVWVFWVQPEGSDRVRIGLTDYLQQHSGDVAFVSVKLPGTKLAAGDELAELETIKMNLSLPAPVSGTVVEVNPALELNPELVNQDPYDKGWLAVLETASWEAERAKLLDPRAYFSVMQSQVEQELKQS